MCDLNLRFVGKRRQDHESQGYCDKSEVNGAKVLNEILRPIGTGGDDRVDGKPIGTIPKYNRNLVKTTVAVSFQIYRAQFQRR